MTATHQTDALDTSNVSTPSTPHPNLAAELDQRLHAQLDQRARRRQRTAALRSELARCRAAGKAARHRRRLAQIEQEGTP